MKLSEKLESLNVGWFLLAVVVALVLGATLSRC
jgi:hypothetical protein